MVYSPQLLTLAMVMLLACISPGPDFVAVSSHALGSRRTGVWVAFGVAAGCMVWALLAVFGLGLLLTQLAWLYRLVRLGGAAYLIVMGARMLLGARKAAGPMTLQRSTPVKSAKAALRQGFLVNMANPKAAVFFGSLFVTIMPAQAPLWVHGATVAIVGGVAALWFTVLALMFSTDRVRLVYGRIRRPVDAVMGAALAALGARLAISD
jgi:RhtB (resistance to homoserine/threonine) family protein